MNTRSLAILAVAVGAAAASAGVFYWTSTPSHARQPDLQRGATVYADYCASCHGVNLEGQPNWRTRLPNGKLPAPPHDATGHTWHHPDEQLFAITTFGSEALVGGGYQSDMAGFGEVLSDDEILDVLAYIKRRWPERERAMQARVTQQYKARR